ncbi:3-hydroxyacyl-ACP dehydratase FabZ [Gordonibacter sp. Marseille-P4307]|uniref:3-hydroxyacyl-ACP dehydratase FabZ n=1 Tax=Gordonibacter sp. Marseille-P4307 TaxID=2161815 RepID=UPI001F1543AF|nr:3-hydroxyacyl-ACP dehydratase FabZ [Gordonibacter sp. Marseille-P4307]
MQDASALIKDLPFGRAQIESILPHRDPFLWVSRVIACDPGKSIVAELDVDRSLELFKGHFPTHPVLPGVIIMESLAQAASISILLGRGANGSIGFLTGIDAAKFRRPVRPGDVLRLEATIVKSSSRLCVAQTTALVDGEVCATATQKYVLAAPERA